MALGHFVSKQVRIARNRGVATSLRTGLSEARWRASDSYGLSPRRETPIWDAPGSWDVCVVLDAARADVIEALSDEFAWVPDEVSSIWSVGSMSPEWIGETFAPGLRDEWAGEAYVTANPFSSKPEGRAPGAPEGSLPLTAPHLGYLDEVWRDQWRHDGISTVRPETMARRTMRAVEHSGCDRVVAHWMQPHAPFRSRPGWFGQRTDLENFGEPDRGSTGAGIWGDLRDGVVDADEIWDAYVDNARWAMRWLDWLLGVTDARVAVTSDHGNGLGEDGVYGHPPELQAPSVREVPWFIVDGRGGNDWDGEAPGDPPVTRGIDENAEEMLEALGYR